MTCTGFLYAPVGVALNGTLLTEVVLLSLADAGAAASAQLAAQEAAIASLQTQLAAQAAAANATQAAALAPLLTQLTAQQAANAALQTQLGAQVDAITTLQSQVAALALGGNTPSIVVPACAPPGGAGLQFNGAVWSCACAVGWTGANCSAAVPNVARSGIATQSSDNSPEMNASVAIDGSVACQTTVINSAMALTTVSFSSPSWWSVDLRGTYNVSAIVIFGRPDLPEQSSPLTVAVGAGGPLVDAACATGVNGARPGGGSVQSCVGVMGRYVSIKAQSPQPLALCEVQVFAV